MCEYINMNVQEEFIKYAKKEYGKSVKFVESDNPDTFEKIFGGKIMPEEYDYFEAVEEMCEYINRKVKENIMDKMTFSEKLEIIYDSIMFDIELCSNVEEILAAIKENFEALISFEKQQEVKISE